MMHHPYPTLPYPTIHTHPHITQSAMPASPFLSLPPELRNRIYALCTPLHAPISDFTGLLLASHQLHREYSTEALKVTAHFLSAIELQWPPTSPPLRFNELERWRDMDRISVFLPLSAYFPASKLDQWSKIESFDNTALPACIAPLYALHLSCLRFAFYDDKAGTFVNWAPWIIPTGLLHDMMDPLNGLPFDSEVPPDEDVAVREFRVVDPVRVRRVEYRWFESKVAHGSDVNSLVQADAETGNFFLQISRWFQRPLGLVRNWGRGADSIWFDLDVEGRGEV